MRNNIYPQIGLAIIFTNLIDQNMQLIHRNDIVAPPIVDKIIVMAFLRVDRLARCCFFKIADEIESQIAPLQLSYRLINKDDFATMKRLQMYEITAALTIFEKGNKKLLEKREPNMGKDYLRKLSKDDLDKKLANAISGFYNNY